MDNCTDARGDYITYLHESKGECQLSAKIILEKA